MIKLIKLISGEEIVGNVISDNNTNNLIVENPLVVVMMPPKQNSDKAGFQFLPWAPLVDGPMTINFHAVVFSETPNSDIIAFHEKAFSKIAVPAQELIIAR